MPHACTIEHKKSDDGIRSKWLSLVMINEDSPFCPLFFKSETGVRNEKIKQLRSKHRYIIIHPLSKFRKWYDVCIFFIYIMMLIVKPIDGSISRYQDMDVNFPPYYREFSLSLDIISWFNIAIHFGLGYTDARNRSMEMRPSKIARRYMFSPFFIIDVISSLPRYPFYYWEISKDYKGLLGVFLIFCMLKSIRIFTVLKLIYKMSYSFHIKSTTIVFLTSAVMASLFILHLSSCLMIAVPKLGQYHFGSKKYDWLLTKYGNTYRKNYMYGLMKSAACLLGIRFDYEKNIYPEDYMIAIIIYVIGKLLIATTWVVLAATILDNRSVDIKYQEIMNQLNEYMRQKQLPSDLRRRIRQFYAFKYQNRFFKEELINSLLTDNLRSDINVHLCRSLIDNVSLFDDLSSSQVSDVVSILVPEIFLPRDIIIQSGTNGDSMYFLSTGTVAVYTHSGREVCHLQDGTYFGEISLVLKGQARTATVVAIEETQVYRLKKKDFEKTFMKNRSVYQSIIHRAEMRMKETLQLEETYKMSLFEKNLTGGSESHAPFRSAATPPRMPGRSSRSKSHQ